ncbi:2'-5' RNA ligase family protein [Streptomyces sp. NPDC060194]|uniref:2'-5' RNA ligase family protein n=1 Tax=Streptomyces sp. NPDC060194 TaxID=3347069 RepID=UPI00365EC180
MAPDDGATGWPDVVGDTALTIQLPEADPLVRGEVPAHITVLYPFLHVSRIDAAVDGELRALFGRHTAFELVLAEFRRYPGVLYLAPEPAAPIGALTAELTARWPEAVPYRGIFGGDGLDPHLTVANDEGPETWRAAYDALEARLAPLLPLRVGVSGVRLIVREAEGWRDATRYPLGASLGVP